jgi:hypothetical protein
MTEPKAQPLCPAVNSPVSEFRSLLLKLLVAALGASGGALLHFGAAWIVGHESINYRLPRVVTNIAETSFAIGPTVWVFAGLVLALPLFLGCMRSGSLLLRLVALVALAYLSLLCGLGFMSVPVIIGLLGMMIIVWARALFLALLSS